MYPTIKKLNSLSSFMNIHYAHTYVCDLLNKLKLHCHFMYSLLR